MTYFDIDKSGDAVQRETKPRAVKLSTIARLERDRPGDMFKAAVCGALLTLLVALYVWMRAEGLI